MQSTDSVAAKTLAFVLAGGEGRRLYPLTRHRPKPLVPFGGCFRILDFTLSNCLNSGLERVYVLTQQDSESMATYLTNKWTRGSSADCDFAIPSPPAAQRRYAGTADAILQNVFRMQERRHLFALVVSADHVYKMDYRALLGFHSSSGAEVTIATVDYPKESCSEMGVIECDKDQRVVAFIEKPRNGELDSRTAKTVQVNMGVYVFNYEILRAAAQLNGHRPVDISLDLIPRLLGSHNVTAYRHEDQARNRPLYWRDVGTLEAYYDASMDLLVSNPPMDPYDDCWPIHSAVGARLGRPALSGAAIAANSAFPRAAVRSGASVHQSLLSPGVVLESGVDVQHSVLLPGAIIRRGAAVRRAIIDANVIIEAGECIGYNPEQDRRRFHVLQNGIVVVSPDCVSSEFRVEEKTRVAVNTVTRLPRAIRQPVVRSL